MHYLTAIISVVICAGCAINTPRSSEPSIGEQLSNNLVKVHEMYCGESQDAKERLSKLKEEKKPFHVVERKTREISSVWVIQSPLVEPTGVKWGLSLSEPSSGGGCGVAYLQPEQLEELKAGYQP